MENALKQHAYFMVQCASLNADIEGMKAENMQRQSLGMSMTYTKDDFDNARNQYDIDVNRIPEYFG